MWFFHKEFLAQLKSVFPNFTQSTFWPNWVSVLNKHTILVLILVQNSTHPPTHTPNTPLFHSTPTHPFQHLVTSIQASLSHPKTHQQHAHHHHHRPALTTTHTNWLPWSKTIVFSKTHLVQFTLSVQLNRQH